MPASLPAPAIVRSIVRALAPLADPMRAPPMVAYMRDQFAFLGIATPDRRAATREIVRAARADADEEALVAAARSLWRKREREYQYAAVDLLVACAAKLTPAVLPAVAGFITTHSWWDTVDALAAGVVGPLAMRHPVLRRTLDAWSSDDNLWLRRTAILHQLRYGEATDARRLFAYCVANACDHDFFVRKAIGWALRQYAYTDPQAVRDFLRAEQGRLSPLSLREAGKHLQKPIQGGTR